MIKDVLIKLSCACGIGHIVEARDIACDYLGKYMEIEQLYGNCEVGVLKGETNKTIMLEAHCDEVGFIITNIDENGFLKVESIGRTDARVLPSKPVIIHGKQKIKGVFGSIPPHLKGSDDKPFDFDSLFVDTGLGAKVKEIVSLGDIVTFDSNAQAIAKSAVCGKSLDNRAGVTALIVAAEKLAGKKLPCNVAFLISWNEELGLRGAKTATFDLMPDCAVSVDVSFGNMPGISADKTRKLGSGTMIGISPLLSRKVSDKLFDIAENNGIKHTAEIMSGKTGTDADVITATGVGIPCGLLSIPLRSMHSCYETVDVNDIEATAQLLCEFVLSGGALSD